MAPHLKFQGVAHRLLKMRPLLGNRSLSVSYLHSLPCNLAGLWAAWGPQAWARQPVAVPTPCSHFVHRIKHAATSPYPPPHNLSLYPQHIQSNLLQPDNFYLFFMVQCKNCSPPKSFLSTILHLRINYSGVSQPNTHFPIIAVTTRWY